MERQNSGMVEWWNGETIEQQNNKTVKERNGEMAEQNEMA
jgi:hypothetical protein